MATLGKVRNDWIPMRAGVARVTPLDDQGRPVWAQAITTKREFIQSIQINNPRATESLPNGNGQDKEYLTDSSYTVAIATDTYDQRFHAVLSGSSKAESAEPVLRDTTIVPTKGSGNSTYVFSADVPVASPDDKKVHLEIRDSFGNLYSEVSSATPEEGQYKFESSSNTLTFAESVADTPLSCVYYVEGTGGEQYNAPSTLRNNRFMLEIMGEVQSAETGDPGKFYAKVARAVVSGDLPHVTTQKPIANTITYNFKSSPVPEGMIPYTESFTPMTTKASEAQPLRLNKKI